MNEYFIEGSLFKLKLNIFGIASWNKRWFAIDSKTEEIYHFKVIYLFALLIEYNEFFYVFNFFQMLF